MTDDQLLQPDPDSHRRFLPGAVRLPARMGQRNGAPGAGWGVALAVGLLLAAFPLRARATAAGPQAPAPSREVAGRVVDSVTGAPVSGARVTVGGRSATTREDGSFELLAPSTARSASATARGYFDNAVPLPDEGPVLIELLPRTFEEEAVEVTAEAPELERPAATRVAPDEVLETAGTVDNIFRALATLPGVTPTTDFGSFLSVRGGTPDQNLTLMDGVEIHNPYRLFGLVSAFNPETVSDFSLAAGGFGAQYGDRLSSLLVVRNRPGERAFGGTSSLSITDGNLVFEGPLPGGGSWLATARRTYYDVIVGRVLDQDFPSFEDFQLRADWEFGPGHRLSLVGLSSREDTDFNFTEDEGAEAGERVDFLGDIGNELGAARLDALLSDRVTATTILSWYRNTEVLDFDAEIFTENRVVNVEDPERRDLPTRIAFERERAVRDLSLRQEIGIQFGARHFLETGFELHGLESSLDQVIQGPRNESAANPSSVQGGAALPDLLVSEHSGVRGGAWVQDAYRVTDRFTVEPGLRLDWSTLNGRATLSPRFAASWDVGAGVQARAAGGLYTQSPGWEKLVSSDYLLDLNAIGDLFHERAVHAVAGLEKELTGGTRLRVEGYWKRFNDLLVGRLETEAERMRRLADYDFPAELAGSVPRDARITINPVNEGAGVARGLDVYLERLDPAARVAGWVSYSYGRAERETYGQRYPFEYDRPHALNVVGRIGITESWSLAATGRLASGFPYTPAVGVRVAAVEDDHGRLVPEADDDGNLAYAADLGGLDNLQRARLPLYARLDLRLTYRRGRWSAYAEVINALNRKNGVAIETEVVANPGGVPTVEEIPSFGFPRVPTVGVRVRF